MGSKRITLSEFAVHQKGFAFKSNDYQDSGVAVVRVSNFTNDSIDINDLKFVSADVANDKTAFELLEDDVVIATVGSWPNNPASVVGKVIRVPANASESLLNQNAVRLRPISNDANDLQFLFYLLKDKTFSDYIVLTAQGSANQASITLKDIYAYEFDCPDYQSRTLIAKNLYALDKKISLNRQINQTLEQMAQTLFKSWFVDFDPVIDNVLNAGNEIPELLQARAELRQKVRASQDFQPLPADVRALFPAEFEESELGWVPKGWVISQIKDIADINPESWNSKTAPSEVEYLDLSNAKDGSILSTEIYSFDEAPSRARRVLNKHDTAFGLVRPANRSFAYIDRNGLTGSTGFAVIRAKKTHYKNYIYCCLTDSDVIDEFARVADGGAYPAIKNEDIVDLNVIFPSEILLKRFDISVSELREKIIINTGNNQTLAELRDTLLPKLISGELRLDDLPDEIVTAANE